MKDYLLSFSILGLVLGFYSALVISQPHTNHAATRNARIAGPITSEVGGNSTDSPSSAPSMEAPQTLTR